MPKKKHYITTREENKPGSNELEIRVICSGCDFEDKARTYLEAMSVEEKHMNDVKRGKA